MISKEYSLNLNKESGFCSITIMTLGILSLLLIGVLTAYQPRLVLITVGSLMFAIALLLTLPSRFFLILVVYSLVLGQSIPLVQVGQRTVNIRPDDILIFMLVVSVFLKGDLSRLRLVPKHFTFALVAFLSLLWISVLFSILRLGWSHNIQGIIDGIQWIEYSLLLYVTPVLLSSRHDLEKMFSHFVIASVIVVGVGVYQSFTITNFNVSRIGSTFGSTIRGQEGNPNLFGTYLMFVCFYILSCIVFMRYRRFKRFLLTIYLSVSLFLLYQTLSRGTWLGFGVGLILFIMINTLSPRLHKNVLRIARSSLLVIPIIVGYYFWDLAVTRRSYDVVQRLRATILLQGSSGSSVINRLAMWEEMWKLFLEFPIFGIGYRAIPAYSRFIYSMRMRMLIVTADNYYLEILVTMGILGLIVFILLLYCIWRFVLRTFFLAIRRGSGIEQALTGGLLASFVGLLAISFTGGQLAVSRILGNLWFLLGLVIVINANLKRDCHL
jgi:O-antigen ligase